MSDIRSTAEAFFEACETGKGWAECAQYCAPNASFSAQSGAIAEIDTLAGYCDWMSGLMTIMPNGAYDLKAFAVDEPRGHAIASAVFSGTHTGEGGPVPPTGKTVNADYVYDMTFESGKITHMTKIWNDGWSAKELGWA